MDDLQQQHVASPGLWRGLLCAGSVTAVLGSGVLVLVTGWSTGMTVLGLSVLPLAVTLLAIVPADAEELQAAQSDLV